MFTVSPNITGYAYPELGFTDGVHYQLAIEEYGGALSHRASRIWTANGVNVLDYGDFNCGLNLDASLSNTVYKNNNTVQPSSIRCLVVCRT